MLANRINSITIRNFRSLGDVTVDMEDLTVLVGANGTGKSNFLNALRFTRDVIREGLDFALLHQGNFLARQDANDPKQVPNVEIEIRLTLEGQEALYSFSYGKDEAYGFALIHEFAQIDGESYETTKNLSGTVGEFSSTGNESPDTNPNFLRLRIVSFYPKWEPFGPIYQFLANLRVYSILPNALRELKPPGKAHSLLDEDGQNFATVLQDFINSAEVK